MNDAQSPKAKPRRRLKIVWFGQINPAPRKRHLVRDFLGCGEMSCLFGPPGCGKSVLAGDLAAHVAAGAERWLGRDIAGGPVLYVAAERAQLVERRLAAWRQFHAYTPADAEGVPLVIVSGTVDLRSNALDADEIIAVAKECEAKFGQAPVLIIVDTLSRALAGGDENSPKDMGAIVTALQRIQIETQAHVMIVHHIPADGTQRLRGHGALLGAVDTTIAVEKGTSVRTATVDKTNDGPEGEMVAFTLETVELHRDGDDVTTAPVVVPAEGAPRDARKTGRRPKAHGVAMEALARALDEMGKPAPTSNHVPPSVRVVEIEEWRRYAYAMNISPSADQGARQKAFVRAMRDLQSKRVIGSWNELVWVRAD